MLAIRPPDCHNPGWFLPRAQNPETLTTRITQTAPATTIAGGIAATLITTKLARTLLTRVWRAVQPPSKPDGTQKLGKTKPDCVDGGPSHQNPRNPAGPLHRPATRPAYQLVDPLALILEKLANR
jgi:hypothetical protein